MITQTLADWAQAKGYREVHCDDYDFDVVEIWTGQYAFSLSYEQSQQSAVVLSVLFGLLGGFYAVRRYHVKIALDHKTWQKEVLTRLRQTCRGKATSTYSRGYLSICLKKTKDAATDFALMEDIATSASQFLSEAGVQMQDECLYCKQAGCDCVALQASANPYLQPAHATCVEAAEWETLSKLRTKAQTENYFPALLLALIGSVVGALPTGILFLAEYFGAFLNMLAYMLVPLGGYAAYRKGNGKLKPLVIPFILLYALPIILALVVAGDFLYVRFEYLDVSWEDYLWVLLYDAEYLAVLLVELLLSWLFGIGGVVAGYFWQRKNKRKDLARMQMLAQQYAYAEDALPL